LCSQIPGEVECKRVRVRGSGANLFVDIIIGTDETVNLADAHHIADSIESSLSHLAPKVDVLVHIEPAEEDVQRFHEMNIYDQMQLVARRLPKVQSLHNIRVFEISDRFDIAADLEMSSDLTTEEAHSISEQFEEGIRSLISNINSVTLHLEMTLTKDESSDITSKSKDLIESVKKIVSEFAPRINYQDATIKKENSGVAVLLDCTIPGEITLTESHEISEAIEKRIIETLQIVITVYVHFNPT